MTSSSSDNSPDRISVATPSEIPVWTGTGSSSPDGPCFQIVRVGPIGPLPLLLGLAEDRLERIGRSLGGERGRGDDGGNRGNGRHMAKGFHDIPL